MMAIVSAPAATATFLFTDIDGSTQLLRAHRADYSSILADHHRLVRDAFTAHGGSEIDNQGDSFFVAFARARDAVLAAADAQRALAMHRWPGGASVRVRMGIHTGEAHQAADRYIGLSVHRAARISALGHGGQILVSPTTAGLIDDDDDLPGLALRDIGEHRLKDIPRPVRLYQLEIDGLPRKFPPLKSDDISTPNRRRRVAVLAAALLLVGVLAVTLALTTRDPAPPEVLPNSLVRVDPDSLEPTDVMPVGDAPDLVLSSGGFVWITHHILRDAPSGALRNAGDRTLTRVDPSTGRAVTVGGGLAPCGLTADPSGDVWVANCFTSSSGGGANVVRVDASSLDFEETWRVPRGDGFYRGLAYGGGSLWVAELGDFPADRHAVAQVDPRTGRQRSIPLQRDSVAMAWSEGYGDLWVSNFNSGSLTRLHPASGRQQVLERVVTNPSIVAVDRDVVWVGDWAGPRVARLEAVGAGPAQTLEFPTRSDIGVWCVAAGAGAIWVTTPRDNALWRIEPATNALRRIEMPYLPTCVAATSDDVWVTVRSE